MSIQIGERNSAQLSLDFATDIPKGVGTLFQPLLASMLDHAGLHIDELEAAKAEITARSVILSMDLSDISLRRVLSMMSSSAPTAPQPQSESKSSTQVVSTKLPTGPDSEASQSYFTSVYQILADLEKMNRKASDYNRTATWHENFARKIDQLPVRGVARELLTYGADVSSKLRSLAASLRGVPLQLNRLENSITYDVKYNPGFVAQNWWGAVGYQQNNYDVRSNSGQIRGEQATAVAAGAEQREDIWRMLADQTTEIRLKMLDLHHLELQMPTGK